MKKQYVVVVVVALAAVGPGLAATDGTGNEAPLADAGLDQTVSLGETVLLDGGGSRDPDGTIEDLDWEVTAPDGSPVVPDCRDCERTSFPANHQGTYSVTLTVTDDDGSSRSDTLYVTVEEGAGPTVSLSGQTDPSVDTEARYRAGADAGDAPLETLVWRVDGRLVRRDSLDGRHATTDLARNFDAATTHEVSVTAVDEAGRTATDALAVAVEDADGSGPANPGPPRSQADNEPPTVAIEGPTRTEPGDTGEFTAVASDSDGVVVDYRWSNVDGSFGDVSWRSFDATSGVVVPISVTVEDDDGATATATKEVTVGGNQAPSVHLQAPDRVTACGQTSVNLTADAEDPDGRIESYRWSGVETSDGTTARITQRVEDQVTRKVGVTVTGEDGESTSVTTEIVLECTGSVASISNLQGTYQKWVASALGHETRDAFGSPVPVPNDRQKVTFTVDVRNPRGVRLLLVWEFGNGQQNVNEVSGEGSMTVSMTHRYAQTDIPAEKTLDGDTESLPVTVSVRRASDNHKSDSVSRDLSLIEGSSVALGDRIPIKASISSNDVAVGETVSLSTNSDLGHNRKTLKIEWGDGTSNSVPIDTTESHEYQSPGTYVAQVLYDDSMTPWGTDWVAVEEFVVHVSRTSTASKDTSQTERDQGGVSPPPTIGIPDSPEERTLNPTSGQKSESPQQPDTRRSNSGTASGQGSSSRGTSPHAPTRISMSLGHGIVSLGTEIVQGVG